MSTKTKTIYELKSPINETYIGQTSMSLNRRWRNGKGYRPNSKVGKAIINHGWDNIEKNVLYTGLSEKEADLKEKEEIEKRGGINDPLVLNCQSGGHIGYKISDYELEKQSVAMKKFYNEHPEVAKEKVKSSKKYYEDNEGASIRVDQYSYDGTEFIKSYNSVNEAHIETGAARTGITKCLTGEYSSAGGYRWVKSGKKLGIIQYPTRDTNIMVKQIDKNTNEVIATYHSLGKAAAATGIRKTEISKCINNKQSYTKDFKWEKA